MSDEEDEQQEVAEEEEDAAAEDEAEAEVEEAPSDEDDDYNESPRRLQEEEKPKPKPPPPKPRDEEEPAKEMSEAEKALMAQKRKREAEENEKLGEYEEQRRIMREKEEEELRLLKEKQERRRQEREEEERIMAERRAVEEERRKAEDEARKQKAEAEKARKEEERKKKHAMGMAASGGGANFEIPKKDTTIDKVDKFGNIVKAKTEMKETKEQHEEAKKKALQDIIKPADFSGLDIAALRVKIKELHNRICRLEASRYDLERRQERQEYDLKELSERQRQIARNKAMQKGLNPEEAANSKHPPRLPTASKYDRQTDRRSYGDRRLMFESPKKSKDKKIFHGSARPPGEWGRKDTDELETLRKGSEGPKYVEAVKVEGARPPMQVIPTVMPEPDPADEEEEEEE